MILRTPLFCFLVCLFSFPAIAQKDEAPKTFPIKLFRPAKSGDRYRLTASESKKQLMILSKDGKTLQTKSSNTRVELDAEVTILKVDDKGRAIKKSVVIGRFVDGKQNELLKKGQVVIAETIEGRTVFRILNEPLPVPARTRLAGIVQTKTADRPDDDAIFGSKQDRAIGESWKVNPASVARELKVDAKTVTGSVTLKGRKKIDGVDCLQIAAEISIRSIPDAKRITKGAYKVKDPSVVAKLTANLPIDTKMGSMGRTSNVTMKATAVGDKPESKGVSIAFSSQMTSEIRRVYRK